MADTTSISHSAGQGTTEGAYLAASHHSISIGPCIHIAASDATDIEKAWARATGGSVCDGIDDEAEIYAAIAAGRLIRLSSGTFWIKSNPLRVLVSNVTIEGMGVDVTTLKMYVDAVPNYGGNCMITFAGTVGTPISNITFRNMTINANSGAFATYHGSSTLQTTYVSKVLLENIRLTGTDKGCFFFTTGTGSVHLRHLSLDGSIKSGQQGDYTYSDSDALRLYLTDIKYYDSGSVVGGSQPLYMDHGKCWGENLYMYNCDTSIDIRADAEGHFTNVFIEGGGQGWYAIVVAGNNSSFKNVQIRDYYSTGTPGGQDGGHNQVVVVTGNDNVFDTLKIYGKADAYAYTLIKLAGTASRNKFINSYLYNNGAVSNNGIIWEVNDSCVNNVLANSYLANSYRGVNASETSRNFLTDNIIDTATVTNIINGLSNNNLRTNASLTCRGNIGFIDVGEHRQAGGLLVAGSVNTYGFNWQNPEVQAIAVVKAVVDVTTKATTGGCLLDVGTITSTGTHSDNLLDGLDVATAAIIADNITNKGTNGKTVQRMDANGGTTDWVTGQWLIQASTGLVGSWALEYIGV